MKIRNLLALLMVGALALTSCNNDRGPSDGTENRPQDVIVSLDLGDGLKAAMGSAQDLVKEKAAASVKNVDVYLTTADGTIMKSKRFVNDSEEYKQLTSSSEIGTATKGGFKFKGVAPTVTRASVVVNPQTPAVLGQNKNVNNLNVNIKANADDAVYSKLNKELEALGVEPIEPNPGMKENVKKVEFLLQGDMSRFQVATKFSVIEFNEGKKEAFIAWKKAYVTQHKDEQGRTFDAKDTQYLEDVKTEFGDFNGGAPNPKWKETWVIVDITSMNKGAFMNDFNNTLALTDKAVSDRLLTTTYASAYTTADGALVLKNTTKNDEAVTVTDFASYFSDNGFETTFEEGTPTVLAFNFFAQQVLGAQTQSLKEKGVAPRLHFFFDGDKVDADHRFVNIAGYDLSGVVFKEAQLLNIDMSKLNNGKGIIVQSDDPNVPDNGKPDVENNQFNLIVRVTVAPWTAVNVLPIAE